MQSARDDSIDLLYLNFLDYVAKGKQEDAVSILESLISVEQQNLLKMSGECTDYSGRKFNCTAYEYAYWAKDSHMRRKLESFMDDDTKKIILTKIEKQELEGISYQQKNVTYKNAHYDMSFILKDLSVDEFNNLKTILEGSNEKLNTAEVGNYKNISFTADEYEQLKKYLAQKKGITFMPTGSAYFQLLCYFTYPIFFIASFFITSPAEKISNKLKFDFHSLITALDNYVTKFSNYTINGKVNWNQAKYDWIPNVGKAQLDVPAHVAHEYCRRGKRLWNTKGERDFEDNTLPRALELYVGTTKKIDWFSSDVGVKFALVGCASTAGNCFYFPYCDPDRARLELAALHVLDRVRITELKKSIENLTSSSKESCPPFAG